MVALRALDDGGPVEPVPRIVAGARWLGVAAWAPVAAAARRTTARRRRLANPVADAVRQSGLVLRSTRQSVRRLRQDVRAAFRRKG